MRRREAELAALWARGAWRGRTLQTQSGAAYTVLYDGRRGGGAGPDFRDAVLLRADGSRVYGDVELHTPANRWRAHGHASDPRYNGVVLHAVLHVTGGERETPLANGMSAPVVVLGAPVAPMGPAEPVGRAREWPCAQLVERMGRHEVLALLEEAGQARFEGRVAATCAALEHAEMRGGDGLWTAADRVLWAALAEGLGYGRDRAALRELGLQIAQGLPGEAALAQARRLGRVEHARVGGLVCLAERWARAGPWKALRGALAHDDVARRERALLTALRVEGGAISRGRALILAANVALPFAAAQADLEDMPDIAAKAREHYAGLPGLPSNAVTRTMRGQLGLARLPAQARAHQGLHHVWATHCREKRCDGCPCNVSDAGKTTVRST